MSKNNTKLFFFILTLLALADAARAQATRVYVAANSGSDANQCVSAAPCKTVAKALTIVDAGGEIILAETGDYDSFFVAKPVTVAAADGVNASIVSSSGGAAIYVGSALQPTDTVSIRRLHIVGAGTPQSSDGIYNSRAGTLNIDDCVFTGLNNALTMSNVAGQLFVHDTTIRGSLFGIGVIGPQGEGVLKATIDNCNLESDDTGVFLTGKVSANVRNSIMANNASRGLQIRSNALRVLTEATVENCQFNHNTAGILVGATNNGVAVLRLSRSVVTDNLLSGVSIGAGGTAYSLGNNLFAGNAPDVNGGALTPLQAK